MVAAPSSATAGPDKSQKASCVMTMESLRGMTPSGNISNMSVAGTSHGVRHCPVSLTAVAILDRRGGSTAILRIESCGEERDTESCNNSFLCCRRQTGCQPQTRAMFLLISRSISSARRLPVTSVVCVVCQEWISRHGSPGTGPPDWMVVLSRGNIPEHGSVGGDVANGSRQVGSLWVPRPTRR